MKLFEISNAYRHVFDRLESLEEIPPEFETIIASIEAELPAKVDAYCALRQEWQAEAELIRAEAAIHKAEYERITALAQVQQNKAERIWNALATELAKMGLQNYRTQRFHPFFQKNPPKCDVVDPKLLPPIFQKVTVEADKKALVSVWKNGQPLPAGVEVTQGVSLRLK